MKSYPESESTANTVNDEDQAVYHLTPWWKRSFCHLTITKIPILDQQSSTQLSKSDEMILYTLKIKLRLNIKTLEKK